MSVPVPEHRSLGVQPRMAFKHHIATLQSRPLPLDGVLGLGGTKRLRDQLDNPMGKPPCPLVDGLRPPTSHTGPPESCEILDTTARSVNRKIPLGCDRSPSVGTSRFRSGPWPARTFGPVFQARLASWPWPEERCQFRLLGSLVDERPRRTDSLARGEVPVSPHGLLEDKPPRRTDLCNGNRGRRGTSPRAKATRLGESGYARRSSRAKARCGMVTVRDPHRAC